MMNKQEKTAVRDINKIVANLSEYYILTIRFNVWAELDKEALCFSNSGAEEKALNVKAACYNLLGNELSTSIEQIYERLREYPFKSIHEIDMVLQMLTLFFDTVMKNNSKEIDNFTNKIFVENGKRDSLYSGLCSKVESILEIKHKQLANAFYKEKHKNRPIFLSGLWGVFGSILGAVIGAAVGAWATLYAAELITWPFK